MGLLPVSWITRAGLVLVLATMLQGCSLGYIVHLGRGQARIICGSEPVSEILEDPEVPEPVKEKIRLVLEAKAFGEERLGLARSNNYTRYYHVKEPPVAYNLTASPRLALEAFRWCFPIAGCLPYKGFFDRKRAIRAAKRMEERGFDTYLRPVAAYSTLGWFTDPIFSTMLSYGDTTLVEVILHEMVHRTIFVKDQGAFNEGVATFVGEKGAEAFFRARPGPSADYLRILRHKAEARRIFLDVMFDVAARLRALYASDLGEADKLDRREAVFADAKESLRKGLADLGLGGYREVLAMEWNNAFVVCYLVYHREPALWEALYERFDGDLPAMVAWLKTLEHEPDPIGRIRGWLGYEQAAAAGADH